MMQSSSNPASATTAPSTSQRDKLRPFVQGLFLEVVQDLYESKEEAEKYARQTEELIHQQTSDDSDYMKNFQQRFEELKELKKKFTMAVSSSPSANSSNVIAATSFSSAASQSNAVGASNSGGAGNSKMQAQAAQRLFAAQQIQQQLGTSSLIPPSSSSHSLPVGPPSPISSANLMQSVRSVADLTSALAQTNSALNIGLGAPNTSLSAATEGSKKRPNPSTTNVSLPTSSPASSSQANAVPGSQANAPKRPRTSWSEQQLPPIPRGSGNASQLLHFLSQAEGKIKANYVNTAGRQQPQERLYFESLLQEVNQIKSEIERNVQCLQDERFQKRVTALIHRLRPPSSRNPMAATSGAPPIPATSIAPQPVLPKVDSIQPPQSIPVSIPTATVTNATTVQAPQTRPGNSSSIVNPPAQSSIHIPPGVQGYHQFWTPKSSMMESSKQMKDLLEFHDSKQGFTVRHQQDDSLSKKLKGDASLSKVQFHVNPASSVPASIPSYPLQMPVQPSPNQTSPHPLSPYGLLSSPGGLSMGATTAMNPVMAVPRQGQVNPVVSGNFPQNPLQAGSTSIHPLASSQQFVSPNALVSTGVPDPTTQMSPSAVLATSGISYASAVNAAAVAAAAANGGTEKLSLTQELAKIREFQLFTLNQVAGQNTRWILYLFDIQQHEKVPSLLVGIRRDYELEEVPVPDMIDYRVQKGKSDISDENIQLLQKVLKQKMQNQRPRLFDLISQWVDILQQLFSS